MKNFADEIAEKYGTRNPFEIAHIIGVVIVSEPLGEIESYYNDNFGQKVIHINSELPEWYRDFVVACQLYNAIVNRELKFVVRERYDLSRESIRFAVHLQTNKEKIKRYGFDEAARLRGVDEDRIPVLRERFYKILEEDE